MPKKCKVCGAAYVKSRRKSHGMCKLCLFSSLVDKTSSPYGCWLWVDSLNKNGYGDFGMALQSGRRERSASRVSWSLTNGDIPPGMHVLHNCDFLYPVGDITNRRCVNPAHLRLGTMAENNKDRLTKGRSAKGDSNGARLHPERMPRGDANGSRKHPESLPRGDA